MIWRCICSPIVLDFFVRSCGDRTPMLTRSLLTTFALVAVADYAALAMPKDDAS